MEESPPGQAKDGERVQRHFTVESQMIALELDLSHQRVCGRTDLQVQPHTRDTRSFRFDCRQCTIKSVTVDDKIAPFEYEDPYAHLTPNRSFNIHHYHFLKARVDRQLAGASQGELIVSLPAKYQVKESAQYKSLKREAPEVELVEAINVAGRFASIKISIEFETTGLRDGLQWIGCTPGDSRWPHVYTRQSPFPGTACCLFPCVDDIHSRNPWVISINTPRTLGDAFRRKKAPEPSAGTGQYPPGSGARADEVVGQSTAEPAADVDDMDLSERDREMELTIATSGELTGTAIDHRDASRKILTYSVPASLSANQIGFALGPFEYVDLSEFREVDDDDKLGEAAIRVHGYCLPGRAAEVRNTCMPIAKAIDFFTTTFTTYTGESFKLCFVDDLAEDTTSVAGLALCSTRLLFPNDVIELLAPVTRCLILSLATQWSGISLVPREPADSWAVAGIATFMTEMFLRTLMGRNEYRFQQKLAADRVYEQDLNRPSLHDLGRYLELDPEERRFMTLKAGVVFFILDQRFLKANGTSGMSRVVGRILNSAKSEEAESSFLSTEKFIHQCTRSGHQKLDAFFNQWVYGSGCPSFQVLQEMNKKKLQILMTFTQTHMERAQAPRDLEPSSFLRETREETMGVWAGEVPAAFLGPMTISIHEADGTPYEHTVEISGQHMVTQIPYNTKYKRMKRGRRNRERNRVAGKDDDPQEEVLLYSLGDVLQTEEEIADWKLSDWDADMEQKMGEESYEWIRMDADFEWICSMNIKMPAYMWMSQLQQDKDVVAQVESLQWVSYETQKAPHPLISTYLLRTLLDKRYFHGIRTMAAERLPNCAKAEVDWIGLFHLKKAFQELYCIASNSLMPRPNDFSDRHAYVVQCAILRGLADIKAKDGRTPAEVKKFFMDTLKFNDNSNNDFSDSFYVSRLVACLTKTLLGPPASEDEMEEADAYVLQQEALKEIQRYKRINQWTPSFHNAFTTTALECLVKLAKADVVEPSHREFLQYTQPEHSDEVRIKAFECLIELGMHKKDSLMAYLLHELSTDPSPYVRENLFRIFGTALGKIAIGDKLLPEKTVPVHGDVLVIEQESANLAVDTRALLERRQTIAGAIKALKSELGDNERLKEAMWAAVKSPILSIREVASLLHLCSILVEPRDGFTLSLKLPRYWTCRREAGRAGCTLMFKRDGPYRTKPKMPLPPKLATDAKPPRPVNTPAVPPAPRPVQIPVAKPTPSNVRKQSYGSSAAARKPGIVTLSMPGPVLLTNGHAGGSTPKVQPDSEPPAQPKSMIVRLKTTAGIKAGFPNRAPTTIRTTGTPAASTFVTPAAPYGFGTISSSPAARSPRSPSVGAMSPPPRVQSSSAGESAAKRRKSSTPHGLPMFAPVDNGGHGSQGLTNVDSTAASPPPAASGFGFAPIQNGGMAVKGKKRKSSDAQVQGSALPPKKRKSETPAAVAEPVNAGERTGETAVPTGTGPSLPKKPVLKIKLSGLKKEDGSSSAKRGPPSR